MGYNFVFMQTHWWFSFVHPLPLHGWCPNIPILSSLAAILVHLMWNPHLHAYLKSRHYYSWCWLIFKVKSYAMNTLKVYFTLSQIKDAASFYKRSQCYKDAFRCFEQIQEFDLALKMYCQEELFEEAAIAVEK